MEHMKNSVVLSNDGTINWSKIKSIVEKVVLIRLSPEFYFWYDDLVQEILVKILLKNELFDDSKGEFKAWINRLTINAVTDFMRKKRNRINSNIDDENWFVFIIDDQYEGDKNEENFELLERAFEQLNPSEKQLLQFKYFDNLSGREIGILTNIPELQVPVKVQRSKIKLKKLFEELKVA
jgi:RNA polymerase sigma factor (sigma-70 family)